MKSVKVRVLSFQVGDVENPDFYASQELHNWLDTEPGQWIQKHSDPQLEWESMLSAETYGTQYIITGYLTPELYTFWKLKYE